MAKKKTTLTETPNKEADIKAFVEENYGKTLTNEDIEKSKKSLKKTTKKHYDDNPELAEARKKQVSDYKNYKSKKIEKENEPLVVTPVVIGVEPETNTTDEIKVEAVTIDHKPIESLDTVVVIEKQEEKKPEPPKNQNKQNNTLSAYGHYHMGLMYD